MYSFLMIVLVVLNAFGTDRSQPSYWKDVNCYEWWLTSHLTPGGKCYSTCMKMEKEGKGPSGARCSSDCQDICEVDEDEETITKYVASMYPGLTEAEKKLASENPIEAGTAYLLSMKAEHLCQEVYGPSARNDESDACRHFVWASLLVKRFGLETAKKYLSAHESEPTQPKEEREMDEHNNNVGIAALKKRNNRSSDKEIIEDFREALKLGRIKVLKPKSENKK